MPAYLSEGQSIGAPEGHRTTAAPDLVLARLSQRQHGVVARRQLLERGVSVKMVRTRLANGRLHELHLGVYAVGHSCLTREGRWLAAVLAAGPGAALSHHSAAALFAIREERSARVDVTTAAKRARTNWIEVHGQHRLTAEDICARDGIPVTTPARTLVDLAAVLDPRELARAVNEADVLGLLDLAQIGAALHRVRGRTGRGAARLCAALERHAGPVMLRSELERVFHELLAAHGLPPVAHNERIGRWEVDACWHDARVAIELDSRRFHGTPPARRRDAAKDVALTAAGWTVRRYRWPDVTAHAAATVAALRALLLRCRGPVDRRP